MTKTSSVVPLKKISKILGIKPRKKLLVASDVDNVLLRKLEDLSLQEISDRTSKVIEANDLDVHALVDGAISWARKDQRRRRSSK